MRGFTWLGDLVEEVFFGRPHWTDRADEQRRLWFQSVRTEGKAAALSGSGLCMWDIETRPDEWKAWQDGWWEGTAIKQSMEYERKKDE